VTAILSERAISDDEELELSLLENLAYATLANHRGLTRKDSLFTGALILLVLAVLLELAGLQ
jgi:hypothetical protein